MLEKFINQVKLAKTKLLIQKAKVLVWDFDGTLYQNEELVENLENEYFKYFKNAVNKKASLENFRSENLKNNGWARTISAYTKKNTIDIMNEIEKKFKKHLYLKKDDYLVEKINSLRNKKHFILSNSRVSDVRKGLEAIGFDKSNLIFEKIIGRDSYKFYKPNPRSFKKIQEFSKLPAKNHLMIGDSLGDDILPAKKVGFQTLHINELIKLWKL